MKAPALLWGDGRINVWQSNLLCQVVLPVRSCAAAIRPDRERNWRARSKRTKRTKRGTMSRQSSGNPNPTNGPL